MQELLEELNTEVDKDESLSHSVSKSKLKSMSKSEKLKLMDDLLLETYILAMDNGQLKANDLGAVVTYLKNNKQVRVEDDDIKPSDEIDLLIEKGIK